MFKYISKILSQFTPAQRIIALMLLLLSIIIITIAPSFISAITLDREELMKDLENKETRIRNLEAETDTLSYKIRYNQRLCTDQIAQREEEFILMLDQLKKELQNSEIKPTFKMLESKRSEALESNAIIYHGTSNNKALRMIENMKKDIHQSK